MATTFTVVCVGTGVSKRYHFKSDSTLISTKDLHKMYFDRLRTLGYKLSDLQGLKAETLFDMYERHKEWARKGFTSNQIHLYVM